MRRSRRNKVEVIRGADGKLAGSRPQAQDRAVAAGRADGLEASTSRWPSNEELLAMGDYDALDVVEGVPTLDRICSFVAPGLICAIVFSSTT